MVVGPDVRALPRQGYPTNPDALVIDASMEGHIFREIATFQGLRVLWQWPILSSGCPV
jgi:hypothetical protein